MENKATNREVAERRRKGTAGGLYQRHAKKEGRKVWIGKFYKEGKWYRTKPCITKSEAREAMNRLRIEVSEKKKPSEKVSFALFADEFLEHARLLNRNYESHIHRMKHLKPFFKGKRLDEITRADIHRYTNWRLKQGKKKATVNRELACLKRMLNYALEIERLTVNPMQRMPMLKEEEHPVRSLTIQEEERLLNFCRTSSHPVYSLMPDVIVVGMHTGMRLSELLELKWTQIDFLSATITLGKTKAKKVRLLPINRIVNETLLKLNQESYDEYVFPIDRSGDLEDVKDRFKYHWQEMCKKVGLKVRIHDLRATFATRLDQKGVGAFTIKALLGHSTMEVTKRYIGVDESCRRAVEALAEDEPIRQKIRQNLETQLEGKPQIM
jgi:integrase